MQFELLHPADQLAMIMQRIYAYGLTTTSGGNLSIRDENGDIWITPSGVDKGALTRADIIRIQRDGEVVGIHRPSVESPFHLEIYRIRPDIKAIIHAHPPALVAFSLARQVPPMRLTPDIRLVCGEVTMAAYDVPGSAALGEKIAKRFSEGSQTVMMENHGCVCGAEDLFRAFMAFETLDFAARLAIYANKLGASRVLTDEQIAQSSAKTHPKLDAFIPSFYSSEERAARREMCELIHRAYDQRLFTSTQGTFSQRLSDGSFLITPYNQDRKYLEPADIVRVLGGMCEAGKEPSRSVLLHRAIYNAHPGVGSVIIAHSAAVMAFAVTETMFESRLIPESYILLRDVKKLPYSAGAQESRETVDALSSRTPVVLVDNQCAIVVGDSLLNAFDRLEVLEYSARAIIDALDIGPVIMISDEEVRGIEEVFG
ncbi:MAG: class II aldolase/adducin family protein [Clostridia bacterium]|nr:class II aldolase/adducin family protein [Clostridia bacterium]